MADFYNLTEAKKFREPWTPKFADAKPMQTYFCKIEGIAQSVMLNKQADNEPQLGQVYGALEMVPGKEYLKFKSEKTPDGVTPPPVLQDMSQPQNIPVAQGESQLDRIEKKLDQLLERKGHEIIAGVEELNADDLSSIPF